MKKVIKKFMVSEIIKKLILTLIVLISNMSSAQIDRSLPDAGPAPEIKFRSPITKKLNNNLTLMIVVDNKLPKASATLIIDNPPILSKDKSGIRSLLSSSLGKGNKYQSKDEFIEEKDFMGSSINYNSSGGSLSSLSRYFERTLTMFAQGAFYPEFNEEEFDKEKTKLIESLKVNEKNASTIARRVEDIIAFGTNHPRSEYTTQESVSKIELNDVSNFYKTYFKPNNAYLVIIGDVDVDRTIQFTEDLFGGWENSKSLDNLFGKNSVNSFDEPEISDKITIHVVDVPNSANVEVTFQNVISRTLKDDSYFSANIANRVLGARPESRLESVIREDKGFAYYARSILPSSSETKTKFQARTTVRDEVVDSAVVEIYNQLKKMSNIPITDEELENAKSGYFGSFAMSMENPVTIANQALNIRTENLPENFYSTFLENINKVSKEEIINSSKEFVLADNSQIIITGKVGNIINNIENIYIKGNKIPVFYHDEYGNITDKPDYSVDSSITAESIINRYINSIGGKDSLEDVQSIELNGSADLNMQGQSFILEFYSLKNNQNQSLSTVSAGGMQVQKSVFNRDQGYNVVNGQKVILSEDELEKALTDSELFSELSYDYEIVELVGSSTIDDQKVYEIKISDNTTEYYSIETGLKVKEVETQLIDGNQIIIETTIKEYQEVNGVLIPSEINQVTPALPIPGGITIKFNTIELNVESTDSDFN
tara:strand:- start:843 stop:2987 length:2145 start_codon:yes stop_codon:yes gene_type:complete